MTLLFSTSRHREYGHMHYDPHHLVVLEVVGERRASDVTVGEMEERLPDVPGKATGHSRDMGPTCKNAMDLVGNVL